MPQFSLEFNKLDERITPEEKLSTFVELHRIASDGLSLHLNADSVGADEVSPIIIHCVPCANPERFYANTR